MLPTLEKKHQDLQARMAKCRGPAQIRKWRQLRREVRQIEARMADIRSGRATRQLMERARPLLSRERKADETVVPPSAATLDANTEQQLEAVAMSLFHKDKAIPVHIQTNQCTLCHVNLEYHPTESLLMCPQCHRTTEDLALLTDHVDLDYVAQDTGVNHLNATSTANRSRPAHQTQTVPQPDDFEKYCQQLAHNVPDPPDELLEIILWELTHIHIHHDVKMADTTISSILAKHKLTDTWNWMRLRISMLLRARRGHETIPSFSDELIQKLKARYATVARLVRTHCHRQAKQTRDFNFLLKVFLLQLGEFDAAEWFENRKTHAVMSRKLTWLRSMCKMAAQLEPDENWVVPRMI